MNRKNHSKRRLSGEDRRSQIIDTALNLFAEKGFAATRTREIAEAAGISETLIFQHFKTKDNLIKESLAVLFHPYPVSGRISDFLNQTYDDIAFFKTIAMHLIEHNREDPRIIKLALYSSLEGRHFGELTQADETAPAMLPLIVKYLQKRMAIGNFVKINVEIAARLFLETVFMFIADQCAAITGPRLPFADEEVVDVLVKIYLGGLKKQ